MTPATITDRFAAMDLASVIRCAYSLQSQIAELSAELDAAKSRIRAAAQEAGLSATATPYRVESSVGTCSVAFVADRLDVVGKVAPEAIRASLPPKLGEGLFETRTVTVLRSGADDFVRALAPAQRGKLTGKVEFRPQAPRVTLPR